MSVDKVLLGRVSARLGEADYAFDLRVGKHRLMADEPASHGGLPSPSSADEYRTLMASEAGKWASVIKNRNVKFD
jgi:hypothetical protein